MNQQELNRIAMNFIDSKAEELAGEISNVIGDHLKEFSQEISGQCLRHIHALSLFRAIIGINFPLSRKETNEETVTAYVEHASQMQPQFMALCQSMRDFEPQNQSQFDDFDVND